MLISGPLLLAKMTNNCPVGGILADRYCLRQCTMVRGYVYNADTVVSH